MGCTGVTCLMPWKVGVGSARCLLAAMTSWLDAFIWLQRAPCDPWKQLISCVTQCLGHKGCAWWFVSCSEMIEWENLTFWWWSNGLTPRLTNWLVWKLTIRTTCTPLHPQKANSSTQFLSHAMFGTQRLCLEVCFMSWNDWVGFSHFLMVEQWLDNTVDLLTFWGNWPSEPPALHSTHKKQTLSLNVQDTKVCACLVGESHFLMVEHWFEFMNSPVDLFGNWPPEQPPLHSTHESFAVTQQLGHESKCLVVCFMFWNDWVDESHFLMVVQWFDTMSD